MSDWASEAGSWYDAKTGEPRYTVIGKNGKERPTHLGDAKKHGFVPGVTRVMKAAAQPGLDMLKQRQVLMSALTATRKEGETDDAFVSRILSDSQEQARKAAERGTEIHAAIERWFDCGMADDFRPWAEVAERSIFRWFGMQQFRPEKSFADPVMGYGGKVDLHSPSCVIDIKTKDSLDGVKLYDEHLLQLAAYAQGLGLVRGLDWPRCGIVFVNRVKPEATIIEASADELARGWRMFTCLLSYWTVANNYDPAGRMAKAVSA